MERQAHSGGVPSSVSKAGSAIEWKGTISCTQQVGAGALPGTPLTSRCRHRPPGPEPTDLGSGQRARTRRGAHVPAGRSPKHGALAGPRLRVPGAPRVHPRRGPAPSPPHWRGPAPRRASREPHATPRPPLGSGPRAGPRPPRPRCPTSGPDQAPAPPLPPHLGLGGSRAAPCAHGGRAGGAGTQTSRDGPSRRRRARPLPHQPMAAEPGRARGLPAPEALARSRKRRGRRAAGPIGLCRCARELAVPACLAVGLRFPVVHMGMTAKVEVTRRAAARR